MLLVVILEGGFLSKKLVGELVHFAIAVARLVQISK